MKVLNLSDGFNPISLKHGWVQEIEHEKFFFSGGEPHIKLIKPDWADGETIVITTRINNMNDLGMLMVARDAIERTGGAMDVRLILPYFPGARQDRQMVEGEPLTAKVYANVINDLDFDLVTILDPHSDVTPALLDNCEVIPNHKFVREALLDIGVYYDQEYFLISPDAGANKKMLGLAKAMGAKNAVKCDKVRDIETGKLSGFEVYAEDLMDSVCVIVDDICDGGGTFMGLAEELKKKKAGDLYLIVTHGIFSKGYDELTKHFKMIYTTDSINSEGDLVRGDKTLVKQIKLTENLLKS
jgi:ribose-phosphate pyrophosphokinase